MVNEQLKQRGICNPRVLDAMLAVPRELFLEPEQQSAAYLDRPVAIECQQTISQPYMVGFMLEAARLQAEDRVLDVGTGSGYAAAVLSRLVQKVFTVERHAELAARAEQRFRGLQLANLTSCVADGSAGWAEHAPFDAILVAAAAPQVPDALRRQLALGGRLIVPVGSEPDNQKLVRVWRLGPETWDQETLCSVRFVPLIPAAAAPAGS